MDKRFAFSMILMIIIPMLASADTLMGKRLQVHFESRNYGKIMIVTNVYTKHYIEICAQYIIEDIYDIITYRNNRRLGTAELTSQDFQSIIRKFLEQQTTDEQVWGEQAPAIARMFADYVADKQPCQ
ncbi:MAG: hypothetical protein LBG90_03705 [Spirochaetaceae bacterium]|jgi:uncharacterized protein (UPF0305 family)|nr:hypothetical protein [Spirochaetaceae bacterium]